MGKSGRTRSPKEKTTFTTDDDRAKVHVIMLTIDRERGAELYDRRMHGRREGARTKDDPAIVASNAVVIESGAK